MGNYVSDAAPRPKGMDAVLRSAFEAGVRAGCGFPVINAVPRGHVDQRFEEWKRDWQGEPVEAARTHLGGLDGSTGDPVEGGYGFRR